jgi:hypothetical protein
MEYNSIIIIVLLFIIALYFLCFDNNVDQNKENFTSKYVANDHIYLGHRRDGNDLLDDSLFSNVVTYNNDDDPYECGSKLGIEKCLENCPGRCIEFGITGIGYCFPPDEIDKR